VKKQRWQERHPGERYSAGWNLSLDCAVSDCKDKGRILYEVSAETEYEEETAEEMMKEFDPHLWLITVEYVTIMNDGTMTFRFFDGTEVVN